MRTLPSRLQPAAVIPGEHVFCFVGLQEVVASELTKDPLSDRVLEAFQELGGEGGGFVKAEAVGWGFGVPVWIDPLEDAVHHAKVEVVVRIEGRAEAMEEADGCKRRGIRCGRAGHAGQASTLGRGRRPAVLPLAGMGRVATGGP